MLFYSAICFKWLECHQNPEIWEECREQGVWKFLEHDFNWDHILGASEWPAEIETPSSFNENMDPHRAAATTSPCVPVPNCPKISVVFLWERWSEVETNHPPFPRECGGSEFGIGVTFTTSKSLGVFTFNNFYKKKSGNSTDMEA